MQIVRPTRCLAAALLLAGAAAAQTLDQSNLPSGDIEFNGQLYWQQQVTAGYGGLLAGIELFSPNNSEFGVSIGLGAGYLTGTSAFNEETC